MLKRDSESRSVRFTAIRRTPIRLIPTRIHTMAIPTPTAIRMRILTFTLTFTVDIGAVADITAAATAMAADMDMAAVMATAPGMDTAEGMAIAAAPPDIGAVLPDIAVAQRAPAVEGGEAVSADVAEAAGKARPLFLGQPSR